LLTATQTVPQRGAKTLFMLHKNQNNKKML
jgi:hypothetical protein